MNTNTSSPRSATSSCARQRRGRVGFSLAGVHPGRRMHRHTVLLQALHSCACRCLQVGPLDRRRRATGRAAEPARNRPGGAAGRCARPAGVATQGRGRGRGQGRGRAAGGARARLLILAGVRHDLVRRAQEAVRGVQALQRGVPSVELAVAQVVRVRQAPLAPAVLVAPLVALPTLGSGLACIAAPPSGPASAAWLRATHARRSGGQ